MSEESKYIVNASTGFCSCLGWKYQRKPTWARTCKHLTSVGYIPDPLDNWKPKQKSPALMLPTSNKNIINDNWLYSEKLDGVRGYWNGIDMLTRNGLVIDIPTRIREQLTCHEYRLDGEFWHSRTVTLDKIAEATQSPGDTIYWEGVQFYVFDIHCNMPFHKRYKIISDTFQYYCEQKVVTRLHMAKKLRQIGMLGGEGLIARNPDGMYSYGRSRTIVKLKPRLRGVATYTGENMFIEADTSKVFKIRLHRTTLATIYVGQSVCFYYTGRTTLGKPKYPRICHDGM